MRKPVPTKISQLVVDILNQAGINPGEFLTLGFEGRLNQGRAERFVRLEPQQVAQLREQGVNIPEILIESSGFIMPDSSSDWRLNLKRIQIADKGMISENEQDETVELQLNGICLAAIVLDECVGRPVSNLIDHPLLNRPEYIIVSARSTPGQKFMASTFISRTHIRFTMPQVQVDPVARPATASQ